MSEPADSQCDVASRPPPMNAGAASGAFFHIAKAAGISLRLLAERHEQLIWVETRAALSAHGYGVDGAVCLDDLPADRRGSLFVFTFVRNPFARFVSCWRMFRERPERGAYAGSFAEFVEVVTAPGLPATMQPWHRTREQWDASPECMRHHLVPQVERLRELARLLGREPDVVGRVERIGEDWARIAAVPICRARTPAAPRSIHTKPDRPGCPPQHCTAGRQPAGNDKARQCTASNCPTHSLIRHKNRKILGVYSPILTPQVSLKVRIMPTECRIMHFVVFVALASYFAPATADDHRVLAAGSLRLAVTEIIDAYAAKSGTKYDSLFGPSGKLRQMIEKDEPFSLFLSASKKHTDALLEQGKVRDSSVFTRNALCMMVAPGRTVSANSVVDVMLDPSVRLGTATPKADPSGDYTWEMFKKIDAQRSGAFKALDAKALQLTGGKVDRTRKGLPYPDIFRTNQADVFVSYCTNAVATAKEIDGLSYVRIPDAINVAAVYGMGLAPAADATSAGLAEFILSPDGQAILERYGFK